MTKLMNLPEHQPRRPYDEDEPDGYMESDYDYVANNLGLAVKLLESYAEGRMTINQKAEELK